MRTTVARSHSVSNMNALIWKLETHRETRATTHYVAWRNLASPSLPFPKCHVNVTPWQTLPQNPRSKRKLCSAAQLLWKKVEMY